MKQSYKPPFKQNAIALGFTLGVHTIAIVGLLFLGLSKPPEPPKKLTTVLVNPEDLTKVQETEQPTVAEHQAKTVQSPIVDQAVPENQPVMPTPPTTKQLAAQKQQTEADTKAKADAEAKRKADADAKAKADAAQKAQQEAAQKKAEAKRIASTAKRDFENKIKRAWSTPIGSAGQKATARVTLNDSGAVMSVIVNSSDPDMKASIEAAVRAAAPYPMPQDPDARREARSFTSSFTSSAQ